MRPLTIRLSPAALTLLGLGARNANALPVVLTTICAYALRRLEVVNLFADASFNDPTIARCINFAKSWGYGRLEVVNLFAYRTSKPSLLKQAAEPIGKDNDRFILESVEKCDRIILAWGNHGQWRKQDLYILELLKNHTHLYSLGITKRGCPRHPLYLHRNSQPQIYDVTAFCSSSTAKK